MIHLGPADPATLGWTAAVADDFPSGGHVLRVGRRTSDGQIMDELVGELRIVSYRTAAVAPTSGLLLLPGVWAAISQVVDPAPHGAEVRRLEEALVLERRRVDDVLASLHRGAQP